MRRGRGRGQFPRDTQTVLVEAAVGVIEREGLKGFTMEAVALAAGVSKGGVFYHFASKQALIRAMVVAALQAFETRVTELDDGSKGGYVRAFVHATIEASTSPQYLRTTTALVAAMAMQPDLLPLYAERFNTWQVQLEHNGIAPERATLARLGAEGLFYANFLGAGHAFDQQRDAVISLLLELAAVPTVASPTPMRIKGTLKSSRTAKKVGVSE